MISQELHALIAHLEITTRKQVSGPLLGDARSRLKGSGLEFNQLREYVQGDDVRFIDWKASARSGKMLVRQYLEDRNRTVYIAVDVSASTDYGTTYKLGVPQRKSDLKKQLAAVLAFVSLHSKDSVGLVLFTDTVEKIIPPRQSRNHALALVQTLYSYEPKSKRTNLAAPLEYLSRLKGQKALVCLLSDFMAPLDEAERMLKVASRKHDLMAFRCLDPRERMFPPVGTLIFNDSEMGVQATIAGGKGDAISKALEIWHKTQKDRLNAARIDSLDLEVGCQFTGDLVRFLRHRIYG